MTENEYREIDEAIDKAQESVVPFPVQTEDELSVVGDANRTELNKHDFTITFLVPQQGKWHKYTKEFKGVYISPRHDPSINKTMTALLPYFRKARMDGSVVNFTDAEKVEISKEISQNQELYDIMRDLVAVVLDIDPELKDYMTSESVMRSVLNIILQYPEMVNEADTFFG